MISHVCSRSSPKVALNPARRWADADVLRATLELKEFPPARRNLGAGIIRQVVRKLREKHGEKFRDFCVGGKSVPLFPPAHNGETAL
jgi:hypothetical protein